MEPDDEAEKLVGGVGQRSLRSDAPASSGELPYPIRVEIATACFYPRAIVRYDISISIAEHVIWGTTEGGGVMTGSIWLLLRRSRRDDRLRVRMT
jgi:hypothetical protein